VATHPLRGAIFESWVASEVMKRHLNQGLEAAACHYREISVSSDTNFDPLDDTNIDPLFIVVPAGCT